MKLLEPIVPTRRFVFWGVVAAGAVATLGWVQHEKALFIAAPIVGAVLGSFGFFLQWARSHPWVLRPLLWLAAVSFLAWKVVEVIHLIRR